MPNRGQPPTADKGGLAPARGGGRGLSAARRAPSEKSGMSKMTRERLFLFDTTLRDGQQTQGVQFSTAEMSSPTLFEHEMPPRESLTAIISAPASRISRAVPHPTSPNPWTATRAPCREPSPCRIPCDRKRSVTIRQPLAVASSRPTDPPRSSGLPVTTGRLFSPGCIMS